MKIGQLADALGLPVLGDPSKEVTALAPIETAEAHHLSFVVSKRYANRLWTSRAGAVIIPPKLCENPAHAQPAESSPAADVTSYLVSDDPYASYARASWVLKPPDAPTAGIHPTADIHERAEVSDLASIGPGVVIGRDSIIHDRVRIDAHCVIGERVGVGSGSRLFSRVSVYNDVLLGSDCRIQSGAVIGAEGFGYAWADNRWLQIQQTGGVKIGDRVHIGANSTIDCGAMEATEIGNDVILDNQVQIAHNVRIGDYTAIAGCVGIAGSTRIGRYCQIGGACNIVGHINIADGVVLNAASLVSRSIDTKGRYGSGTPLLPEHAWRRSFVNLGRLDALVKRVRRLERWSQNNKS